MINIHREKTPQLACSKVLTVALSLLLTACTQSVIGNEAALEVAPQTQSNDAVASTLASTLALESEISSSIVEHLPWSIDLLEKSVNINSGTLNLQGVRKVGELFKPQFERLGFETEWIDGGHFERAGHLVARYGDSGPKILLIGHLDTVFSLDDDFQDVEWLDGEQLKGPGSIDMKGGVVIILLALKALYEKQALDGLQIRVVLTGDEERSGDPLSASKAELIDAGRWADIALGFEDGDGRVETAVIARRGSLSWQLEVKGNAAHSSQVFTPEVGAGAAFEMARILQQMRLQLQDYGDLSFNPGIVAAGTRVESDAGSASANVFGKTNVVAQTAIVKGGLRCLTPAELEHAKKVMHEITKSNLPGTSAQLSFDQGYPPMAPTEGNRALLALYSKASQDLGFAEVEAVNPRDAGAADISFVAEHVEMALDGLGLMGSGGHTKDETADMSSLMVNASKAAILLHRLRSYKSITP